MTINNFIKNKLKEELDEIDRETLNKYYKLRNQNSDEIYLVLINFIKILLVKKEIIEKILNDQNKSHNENSEDIQDLFNSLENDMNFLKNSIDDIKDLDQKKIYEDRFYDLINEINITRSDFKLIYYFNGSIKQYIKDK